MRRRTGSNRTDRYLRVRRIDGGSFAAVWLAWDLEKREWVALKVLKDHGEEAQLRFVREQGLMLEGSGIVPVLDAVLTEPPFLVMPLARGGSLAALVADEAPIAPGGAVAIVVQIAEALAIVHAAGVVHRDVHPGNVVLDPSGSDVTPPAAYLADFGLALRIGSSRLTSSGVVPGAAGYRSPEVCELQDATDRSDVYSLGVLTYELLTGQRVVHVVEPQEVVGGLLLDRPLDLPRPPGPDGLWALLASMLEEDQCRRPSAKEVVAVLAQLPQGGVFVPSRIELPDRPPKPPRRRGLREGIVVAVAVLAFVGVGALTAAWLWQRDAYSVGFIGDQVAIRRGRPGLMLFRENTVETSSLTSSDLTDEEIQALRSTWKFSSAGAARSFLRVLEDKVSARALKPVVALDRSQAVAVASNGTIYASGVGGQVVVSHPDGTETRFEVPGAPDSAVGLAVGPDDDLYISNAETNRVFRRADDGDLVLVAGGGNGSGDGNALAAELAWPNGMALDGDGTLYLAETAASRVRRITPDGSIETVRASLDGAPVEFTRPWAVAVDDVGNLYVADSGNDRVVQIELASGRASIVPSTEGRNEPAGRRCEGGLKDPFALAIDHGGALVIADTGNHRVCRMVVGGLELIAGDGTATPPQAGRPPTAVGIANPFSVATSVNGELYFAIDRGEVWRTVVG